jgi:DNA-binding SARP family transcriptional activator
MPKSERVLVNVPFNRTSANAYGVLSGVEEPLTDQICDEPGEARGLAIGLLGPFEVSVDGRPVPLTAGRLRALLAVLAMSAGRSVPMERLAEVVWCDRPPHNSRRSLQTYAGRLRIALGARWIETRGAGLVLHAHPDRVDAIRFARLLDHPTDDKGLIEALRLWRGEPFEGVDSRWLAELEAPLLVERYLAAVERQIDLDLAAGRHGELVGELDKWVARYPARETLWVRLMAVLDRSGRRAEALRRFEQVRQRLAGELGVDPGPELQQAHRDLLVGRRLRSGPECGTVTLAGVPRQLPPDVDGFVGRSSTLEFLAGLVLAPATARSATIAVITGTAGVGKTALAVHWAHSVADRFADGQLYLDLRGFGPTGKATEPADAFRALLEALGTQPDEIPAGLDAQIGLYRTRTAGRRLLLVLDNARDAAQVRPLLPAGPSCRVVVTSRNRLTGLVATDSAVPVSLNVLTLEEARQLLVARAGHRMTGLDPTGLDAVAEFCARLPLALVIAAARLVSEPDRLADSFVAEVRDRLDLFDDGDSQTDIRAVLSWSYAALRPAAARLFRLIGFCGLPALSVGAAASLAAIPVRLAGRLLDELGRVHLVTEAGGRYGFHDLLRAYAGELAVRYDPRVERAAAIRRLLDHYLHSACLAAARLDAQAVALAGPPVGVAVARLPDRAAAHAWFDTESVALPSLLRLAADQGLNLYPCQLGRAFADFLDRSGRSLDWTGAEQAVLDAACRLGDRAEQARAYRRLGRPLTHALEILQVTR